MFLPAAKRDLYEETIISFSVSADYNFIGLARYSSTMVKKEGPHGIPFSKPWDPPDESTKTSTGKNGDGGTRGRENTSTNPTPTPTTTKSSSGPEGQGPSTNISQDDTQGAASLNISHPVLASAKTTATAGASATTRSDTHNNSGPSTGPKPQHHGLNPAQIVAAVIIPLLVLAAIGALVFICLRRGKRQRAQHHPILEKKELHPDDGFIAAHYASSTPTPHLLPPAPAAVSPTTPPVLLTTVAPGASASYYTGIDTSDAVSMHSGPGGSQQHNYGPVPYVQHEEPPPPYRPRSLVPSRETSLRNPSTQDARLSSTQLLAATMELARSPFADPETDDEDALSDISEPTHYESRGVDEMSAVSDLSYQDEPTQSHHPV